MRGNADRDMRLLSALSTGPRDTKHDISAVVIRPLLIVGLIVCYMMSNPNQLANYIFLQSTLDDMDSDFNAQLEASCAAAPGSSSLCIEAQLFRGWHDMPDDAPGSLEKLLEITPEKPSEEQSMPQVSTSSEAIAAETESQGKHAMLPSSAGVVGQAEASLSSPPSLGKGAEAQGETLVARSTHDLTELQERLEAKREEQANRHAQHRALRELSLAARGVAGDTKLTQDITNPPAHKLDGLTDDIKHHMEIRRKVREDARKAVQGAASVSAAALQNQKKHRSFMVDVQAAGWELCQDPHRHDLPACAQFLKPQAVQNDADEAHDHGRTPNSHHESHQAAMMHMRLLEKHLDDMRDSQDHETATIKQESEQMLKDLCADPARSSYPACAQFLTSNSTATASQNADENPKPSSLRGSRDSSASTIVEVKTRKNLRASVQTPSLSWDSMKAWETKHGSEISHGDSDATPVIYHRQDERLQGEWKGDSPMVACITVLPLGQVTDVLMKSFMDNYHSQDYEGKRRLVIVYHKDDQSAADIVRPYVDGKSVITAASFGEGRFISSTAYRYGGWVARDADITAQWDFDAWHHPLQLSMQVRAMAVSARPASVVTWVTDFNSDGTQSHALQGGFGQHGSMVGETSWMRKNWMPLIEEEHSVPIGLHAREVVQVDMPELLVYHDMRAHEQFVSNR